MTSVDFGASKINFTVPKFANENFLNSWGEMPTNVTTSLFLKL